MSTTERLLLLLTTALAISVAAGEVPACSSIQFSWFGACQDCPFKGLAMPRGGGCFEQFHVRRSFVCRSHFSLNLVEKCRHGDAQVARVHDLRRDEASSSETPDISAAALVFLFSTSERPLDVERFLIWKKKDCELGVANYSFFSLYGPKTTEPTRAYYCWPEDEGDFISVVCSHMVTFGLAIYLDSPAAVSDCDIPAEVEVYGTKPAPVRSVDAKQSNPRG